MPDPDPDPLPTLPVEPVGPTDPVTAAACPIGVPSAEFTDVPADGVHSAKIDCMVWWALADGIGAGQYGPARDVTRGQMATFLAGVVQAAGRLPVDAPDRFPDDTGNVHEASIDALAALGVVRGTSDGGYSPHTQVTRAQMASFLVGLQELLTGVSMTAGTTPFEDIAGVHETAIAKAYTAGLTTGLSGTAYGAAAPVRRDQMASFLMREVDVLVRGGVLHAPVP